MKYGWSVGLVPVLAAGALLLIETALRKAGSGLSAVAALDFALAYLGAAPLLVALHRYCKGHEGERRPGCSPVYCRGGAELPWPQAPCRLT